MVPHSAPTLATLFYSTEHGVSATRPYFSAALRDGAPQRNERVVNLFRMWSTSYAVNFLSFVVTAQTCSKLQSLKKVPPPENMQTIVDSA